MSEENMSTGNTDYLMSLGEKLRQAVNEIDTIKNSFEKNTNDLLKIKNMLDVDNIGDISDIIEKFEGQIIEAERKKEEAFQGAKKYSEELEKEKERLIKLWDAYKNQEEELSKTERKLKEFEGKANNAETTLKQLENDYNVRIETIMQKLRESEEKSNQFNEYKQKVDEFYTIQNKLEEENTTLKTDISNKENKINSLEEQINNYKEQGEYKDKFTELSSQYEKEKERLTKLYKLYEETESECDRLKKETKGWQSWYDSNKEIFNKLFSTTPPINNSGEKKTETKTTEEETEKKADESKNNSSQEQVTEKKTQKQKIKKEK